MKTALVWDERYLKHDTGPFHPENPARLKAIKEVLDKQNTFQYISPRLATPKEVGLVHHQTHIQNVENIKSEKSGYFDGDTPFSAGSYEAAYLAAGGVLSLLDVILENKATSGFAFPRPPGHHAEGNKAMGFCIFNNIAIGAEYLLKTKGLERVAIVDIDVHHGNGTQHSFYHRKDVFFISTHHYPFYPGTGAKNETGEEEGLGYTLNIPFPALSDDDDYLKAYDEKIMPALFDYKPQFILVSAGFDAHYLDPLGGLKVSKKGFQMMALKLMEVAKKCAGGKIMFVLEGGYDKRGLQEGVEAVLESF